ncbi:protocatechuate 4,5-dioxygenase subunit alpha (plasmid) [Sphingobium limneticum]|uniref:protocatechuate 4,5-dioxygenase subunit alpha n=1 Tax=Nitrobacter sp. TaxID=29420 RepID=UPI000F7683EF|nr:protocatechuate 4,5-dioxygenase subunit alpha [Nitrobacter sp.]QEH80922.1 protocatechuate 4,5-dioxygenase subunit alpha [Sphingomonas sp. C8-2]
MSGSQDIHAYLAELEDIPGTRVYTASRARKGYWMNQFAMSLMKADNRERWKADERAYIDEWPMTEEQKQAILARDYNRCLDLGGNIYFLAKVFSTDGLSFLQAVGTMTGMSPEDYQAMMIAGGRSPEGVRSIRENAAQKGNA